jgi:hypothetical protein
MLLFPGAAVSDCLFMRPLLLFTLYILRLGCTMDRFFTDGIWRAHALASNKLCLVGASCAVFAIVEQTGRRPGTSGNCTLGPRINAFPSAHNVLRLAS